MKITLTGSLGNITKPLIDLLVADHNEVVVITRDANKTHQIESMGAKAAIGSISDVNFLTETFRGSNAVYLMVPPNWATNEYRKYIAQTGEHYAQAIAASGVKRIVSLSSIGAHLDSGTGPIAGLYDVEQRLNQLTDVSIKYLRPGIFYVNFFFDIPLIKSLGVMMNNYSGQVNLAMTSPKDVAKVAARELQNQFTGKGFEYVVSDEREIDEVVRLLGQAVDKPDLRWVKVGDQDVYNGMIQSGMPEGIAQVYVEMGNAIDRGILFEDFQHHRPLVFQQTKLEDFLPEFKSVYNQL